MLTVTSVAAQARDCSVSKVFELKHAQSLAGVLEDPIGAVVSGRSLELRSAGKVFRILRTDNQGRYNFGEVPAGKYQIHILEKAFCAPEVKCGNDACSIKSRVKLNSKEMVRVD
jgi:hypothetical protein